MRALQIEFNQYTGKRAGGINPRDPFLHCFGWQNLVANPAIEIRAVLDDRDLSQYEGTPGVTVLGDDAEIDAAIDATIPTRYSIRDETLFRLDMGQRGIQVKDLRGENDEEVLRQLKEQGVRGIGERRPLKTADVNRALSVR